MSDVEVVWSRRLRPKWKGTYVAASGIIGVALLWITWDPDDERRSSGGRYATETVSDVAQFVGVAAVMLAGYGLFCWAPRARLGRDGVFRYRAVFTSSQLDVRGKGAVVVTASPVAVGGRYGKHTIGRWVMEVRPHDDAVPLQRPKLALYQVPAGVVGVASPPLQGEELARLMAALSAFATVTVDDETLRRAAGEPRVGDDQVPR
jgi:hypothetical protein